MLLAVGLKVLDAGLLDIILKRDWLVALATELGDGDRDETAESHADEVREGASKDTNEDGDEDREESAAKEHVHAVVVVMVVVMAVVIHVVRAVVSARTEPVGWLAVERLLCHRVGDAMGARHAVGSLVAAGSSLAHVLEVLNAVCHDTLPLAQKRPLLALLLLANWCGFDGLHSVERGDHQAARGVLQQVDGDGRWVHGCGFDRGDLEGHGEQLNARLGHGLGGVEVEGVSSNAKAQRLLGLGVDLSDVERLRGDRKGGWVELNAIDLERIFMGSNLEVEKL